MLATAKIRCKVEFTVKTKKTATKVGVDPHPKRRRTRDAEDKMEERGNECRHPPGDHEEAESVDLASMMAYEFKDRRNGHPAQPKRNGANDPDDGKSNDRGQSGSGNRRWIQIHESKFILALP